MEQSYTDTIHGTNIAHAAGEALAHIESVSAHLYQFINNVAIETKNLTATSNEITLTMNKIKKVTYHNLAGTKQTANLTGKLAELAKEQQKTVNNFKLPTSKNNNISHSGVGK